MKRTVSTVIALSLASALCVPCAGLAYATGDEGDAVVASEGGMPDFAGSSLVQAYLDGASLTLDDIALIDLDALRDWDASIADDILALKAALEAAAEPEPAPADPEVPEGPAEDAALPEDGVDDPAEVTDEAAPTVVPDSVGAVDDSFDPYDPTQEYPEWSYSGDTSFDMIHYTEDMDAQKLIAAIGEPARQAAQEYDISASEMIALAVVTSNSGRNVAAQAPVRNLFRTVDDEGIVSYDSYGDSLRDHAARVATGEEASIPDDGTWGGAEGSLASRVQSVIEDYDLTRYDAPLTYEPAQALTVSVWDEASQANVEQPVTLADVADQAITYLGVPYVWGGTTPDGFDCSGLVQYAYAHALQVDIPRTTYYQCLIGEDVDFADLHTGDLLFFTKEGVAGHVAMYLGEGCYIEAPQPGMEVKITAMDEKMPTFAKRIISTVPVQEQSDEADAEAVVLTPEQAERVAEQDRAAAVYAAWRQQLGA